jgi:5-methyltetrahydrofolate--homocysteine methyltransferase
LNEAGASNANAPLFTIIGDRINPGFRSTKALLDAGNMAGVQALAKRQVDAGAAALDFTIGPRAKDDPQFLVEVIRAVQAAVTAPICFDYPEPAVQEVCLKAYDADLARGAKPIINSISETRWTMVELLQIRPCRVMLMASERLEDGIGKPNKTAAEIAATAKRAALRLAREHGLALDDVIIDVSISALIADTAGMNREALAAIGLIGSDPELKGIHISGGLSNIAQQLPPKAADGSDLKLQLECAFLTLARPLGMDTVLATPWRGFQMLPEDNYVLGVFKQVLQASGTDVLRQARKLYRK